MPAVAMSRRHAAGGEGARGVLISVLGELVLPSGGTAWTSALIEVLSRLGIEEKATRQVLMRTAADGWLTAQKVGRRTYWQISDSARQILTAGTERIYGFTGAQQDWDGRWLLVMARVPETERPSRHLLRTRLEWAGFGSPSPGLWISTHPDRVGEVERVLAEAGVAKDAQLFVAEHAGIGDPSGMVRQAWDLSAIEQSYREFLHTYRQASSADRLTQLIELVHAWRRFPAIDPALPTDLLPANWSGVAAARVFARRHAEWAPAARLDWDQLNSDLPDEATA